MGRLCLPRLEKEFDTVPFKSFLWELETPVGVHGKLLERMESYQTGKQINTIISDKVSSCRSVTNASRVSISLNHLYVLSK